MKSTFFFTTLILCVASLFCPVRMHAQVEAEQFAAMLKEHKNACLIDCRRETEFAESHLHGAININYLDSALFHSSIATLTCKKVFIYCRSGKRSAAAAKILRLKGFDVVDLRGGILAWKQAGLPVE